MKSSILSPIPRRRSQLAVVAATAILVAAWGSNSNAAGAFDTTDANYQKRAAEMVAQDRIRKECLPSSATAADPRYTPIPEPSPELVAAASKEGALVLNSGISDKPSVAAYKAAFELRYPDITMTIAAGGSSKFEARFLADHAAGNQPVDAAISNKIKWVGKAYKDKALYPLDKTIPGFFDKWPGGQWKWETKDGSTAPAFFRSLGIAYNSDLVKGDLIPKSFADLARPEFKGQLLGMDPEYSATFARVWKQIMDSVDEDTMRKIGDNLIKNPLYSDIQVLAQVLGAGGGMVSMEMGGNVAATMQANGAPVVAVMPETATGTQYVYGVATDAKHPNAAKLFAYWLYSSEGQWVTSCAAYAGTLAYPGHGSKNFRQIVSTSKEEIARIKDLLGLK